MGQDAGMGVGGINSIRDARTSWTGSCNIQTASWRLDSMDVIYDDEKPRLFIDSEFTDSD